jgi:carbamoyl-phosphate synthase large subunit
MAIGRTFKEALQKGIRSMEVKRFGFGLDKYDKWLNAQQGKANAASPSSTDNASSDKTTQGESLDQEWPIPDDKLRRKLAVPSQGRLYYLRYALKMGWTIDQIYELTKIDRWFLGQMKELVEFEDVLLDTKRHIAPTIPLLLSDDPATQWHVDPKVIEVVDRAKQWGYSDVQIGSCWALTPAQVRAIRQKIGDPVCYKLVDTCAAEFEASTPYYYSTYETPYSVVPSTTESFSKPPPFGPRAVDWDKFSESMRQRHPAPEDEIRLTDRPKVIIIGGGPNRIGQGIEFDYCCVQAAFAMRELGIESVMINSNPETVSTDYDTSDLLFFEPLTHEDILNICERLNGGPFGMTGGLVKGVIVQFGGQTPLNLAKGLEEAGVPIIGTAVKNIDAAGDREQFRDLLKQLGLKQPENGIARNVAEAREIARRVGYPVLVRPSFVLGGRAMEIVSDEQQLNYYMANAVEASTIADAPILVDKFLDAATECDVDCLADYDADGSRGEAIVIGVMEHIEEAGIHSGDSACALPPYSLSKEIVAKLKEQTKALAKALRVRGLMNVQYAIKDGEIYVIEVNPRASRTVPFVGKATGIPWAKIAAKVMAGKTLKELGVTEQPDPQHVSVKEAVFPFSKFPGVDVILGPEMRSTGEVMGIDRDFPMAFAKSQLAAGTVLPTSGTVFISVRDGDKDAIIPVAKSLADAGFEIIASSGTYKALARNDIPATKISKLAEGRPNIKDYIKNGKVSLIINTPTKKGPATDEGKIRSLAVLNKVPIVTTITGANAAARAIQAMRKEQWGVRPLQDYFSTAK